MKRETRRERALDQNRTITIIISVVVALVLWAYVMIQINPTKTEVFYRIPVKLLNEQTLTEKQLAILGDKEYIVDVEIAGKRSDISGIGIEDIEAEIQLFGWSKGENYITVEVRAPSDLKVVKVKPDKIMVSIEDLVTISKPVVVSLRGEFPQGTEEDEIVVRPSEIEVRGAKTAVGSVHSVKVFVDVEDISTKGVQLSRDIVPLNLDEAVVEYVELSSKNVNVYGKLLHKKEVNLITSVEGHVEGNFQVELESPNTVVIKGEKATIDAIDAIEAEAINLSNHQGGGNVELKPLLPRNVKLAKENTRVMGRLIFVETSQIEFHLSRDQIEVQGLQEDLSMDIAEEEIILKVIGEKTLIEDLQIDQIKFFIELEGLDVGEHQVPVYLVSENELKNIEISPSEITIRIEEAIQETESE